MRLGGLCMVVCCLILIIIYLMDFLYFQRGLESRPCHEILYNRCTRIMHACAVLCLFMSIHCRNIEIEATMYCVIKKP
jgi:hypothetical protein